MLVLHRLNLGVYILAICIYALLHDAQAQAYAQGLEFPPEIEVNVELIHRTRSKRSISHSAGRSRPDYDYQVRVRRIRSHNQLPLEEDVHGFLEDLNLHLRPTESVFGPNFHYTELSRDLHGNEVWNKLYPSRAEIESIENRLYTDPSTNTVVRLEASQGQVELDGVINGARIRRRRRRRRDIDLNSDLKDKVAHTLQFPPARKIIDTGPTTDPNIKDYMIFPGTGEIGPRAGERDDGEWIGIEPELVFVLDSPISAAIGGERADKLEYVAITVNGINNQFSLTNKTLGIKCELVGLLEVEKGDITSYMGGIPSAPPVLDANGTDSVKLYATQFLHQYSRWLHSKTDEIGPHDLAPLLTEFMFDSKGLMGVAHMTGACRLNMKDSKDLWYNLASPVVQDIGAYYFAMPFLAHEIGHSLGSPHDGEKSEPQFDTIIPSTEACPWSDGYLMTYVNNHNVSTTNRFRFSDCSLQAMRAFIRTETAACLSPKNKVGKALHLPHLQAGDIISSEDICRKSPKVHGLGLSLPISPDEQCRRTLCIGVDRFHGGTFVAGPPGNNAPCGLNKIKGKCRNGYCIGQGPVVADMSTLCKIYSRDPTAYYHPAVFSITQVCDSRAFPCAVHFINASTGAAEWDFEIYSKPLYHVLPGTHCGENKICFNRKCMEASEIRDPNKECILGTGKQEAVQTNGASSHQNCTPSIKCTYGSESEYIQEASTNICTLEDGSDGVCSEGDCVPMTKEDSDPDPDSGSAQSHSSQLPSPKHLNLLDFLFCMSLVAFACI